MLSPIQISSILLLSLASLASSKPITGSASILVMDLTTGVDDGCLNASGQVQAIGTPCAVFTAVASTQGNAEILDESGLRLGFELDDPSVPSGPEDLVVDVSTFVTNTWSLKGNVLSTDPEGSVFTQLADGFVQVGTGVTGTPISLLWVNV